MARKYQKIWEKVKNSPDHKCSVQVHKLVAARTVKAVVKEKYNDAAFKLANPNDRLYLAITRKTLVDNKHIQIDFELKAAYGLVGIQKEIDL